MIRRRDGAVLELCIDAPATRNALGLGELEALAGALDDIGHDRSARVVVLSATGYVFSSGANLADLGHPERIERSAVLLRTIIERIAELDQPVVCRVNGDAYGGALAIIAAADLSVATAHARFALPEARYGLVATVAAAACVRRIGLSAALDIFLTGRRFEAPEACRMGLLTAVTEAQEDEGEADQLDELIACRVNELLQGAPTALAVTKRVVRALEGVAVGHDLRLASELGAAASSAEAASGTAAAADRVPPEWHVAWDDRANLHLGDPN